MEQTSSSDVLKFLHACETGDVSWVEKALSSGLVQVDDIDEQGITGLQMAAANGHEDLVRLLIMRGAALEKSNNFEWSPLLHAARHGHTGVIALLLQNNADINKKTRMGANALTCAVRGGHAKTVQFLLDNRIDFDTIASPCELSAMFVASLLGHDASLRLLTDRGWDINQRMQSTFMTPLMCAAINGHMTTAQVLMERGCDPNISDVNDKTALQLASDRGKREVMGFLDRKTLNKPATVGEPEIDVDILEATKSGDIERVREILLTDDSLKDFCVPQEGATALIYASMSGRLDIVTLLVENGCDVDKQDKISGWTALMQAVFHGKKQIAKFLINHGADVSITSKNGMTAFDMASFIDDVDKDLLRLLASRALNSKPNSNKSDTLKKNSSSSLAINGLGVEKSGRKWWSNFPKTLKNLTKTISKKNKYTDRTDSSSKSKSYMSRMSSTSTMNLSFMEFGDRPLAEITNTSSSFMDKKKSASLFHLNTMGHETLQPVIPPFFPQPSYNTAAADTWALPSSKNSQSTMDLTVNNKHPMIRPNLRGSSRDSAMSPSSDRRFQYSINQSPSSSGGASSISAVFSAPTSCSSATSSTLTPNNVDRFHKRAADYDMHIMKPPSFLVNANYKYSSLPRMYNTGISPTNSASSSSSKRTPRLTSSKQRSSTSPNFSLATRGSKSLSDSGTSAGNSDFLSASGQGVILEQEEAESNDLGSVLKNLSLEKYQDIFEKEEIDMEAFLTLSDGDLCELGIEHEDSRRQILSAINDLSSGKQVKRHQNELGDDIEASIRVRNSVHSDSTDLDECQEWFLHAQPKLHNTQTGSDPS